ncbi:MAG: prepilin-type N-terminal cleavage/methylation domain-containing protein [Nitrospirota bacterium]|jgi:prepilin-type N-terminal cleavage/methylation domain-containing protein
MLKRSATSRRLHPTGFTLIELLVVIAIIAILAGIAVPMFLGQRTKAAFSEARSNLENLRLLEEQYFAENGRYTPDPNGTAVYNTTSQTIPTYLPGFKPGDAAQLNFQYILTSSGTNGELFTAQAIGRSGTSVDGSVLTLNQDNEWGP